MMPPTKPPRFSRLEQTSSPPPPGRPAASLEAVSALCLLTAAGIPALHLLGHLLRPLRRRLGLGHRLLGTVCRRLGPRGCALGVLRGSRHPRFFLVLGLTTGQGADHHEAHEASYPLRHKLTSIGSRIAGRQAAGIPRATGQAVGRAHPSRLPPVTFHVRPVPTFSVRRSPATRPTVYGRSVSSVHSQAIGSRRGPSGLAFMRHLPPGPQL